MLGATALFGSLPAQQGDPYTAGRPAALQKLCLVALGPFALGDEHGSRDVDELLGVRVHWLETRHFRIGCGLDAQPLPDDARDRKAIYAETRRLQKKHGAFPATPVRLDEWLQLHLLAQRLEDLYADFQQRAGISDAWLAANKGDKGCGPHMGCREKFVVLVFQAQGDLVRYLRRFTAGREDRPWMQYFPQTDCFLFATSAEACNGAPRNPQIMHGHVVHGVCQNLVDAFCGQDSVPFWLAEGLAHWYARRIDPRLVDVTNVPKDELYQFTEWDWPRKVSARLQQGLVPDQADLLTWYDGRLLDLSQHAVLWSLTEFLMAQEAGRVADFLRSLRLQPLPSKYLLREKVLAWHQATFQSAFGWDLLGLDARWRKHVLTRYPQ